jgi:hypothetical protein
MNERGGVPVLAPEGARISMYGVCRVWLLSAPAFPCMGQLSGDLDVAASKCFWLRPPREQQAICRNDFPRKQQTATGNRQPEQHFALTGRQREDARADRGKTAGWQRGFTKNFAAARLQC